MSNVDIGEKYGKTIISFADMLNKTNHTKCVTN